MAPQLLTLKRTEPSSPPSTGRHTIGQGGSGWGKFLVECLPPHWNPGRVQQHLLLRGILERIFLARQESSSYYGPSYGSKIFFSQTSFQEFLYLQNLKRGSLFPIEKGLVVEGVLVIQTEELSVSSSSVVSQLCGLFTLIL